ncbi:MAG: universal stress protein [Bacteroidota bacterium]|nr:universal stress protein [Bacteroidota bacterium]
MKKVLIAIDCYSGNSVVALEYILRLSQNEPNLYVGVYVQNFIYENVHTTEAEIIGGETLGVFSKARHEVNYQVVKDVAESTYKDRFIEKCQQAGLKYKLHSEDGLLLSELLRQSEYADLLVIGYNSLASGNDRSKRDAINYLLSDALCPVMVIPEITDRPGEIILAYDNTAEAAHAIKQFAYMFPEQCRSSKTYLVSVMESEGSHIRDSDLLQELTQAHYPDLSIHELKGSPGEQLFLFTTDKKSPIIVMAGFGRGFLSKLLWPSVGQDLVKLESFPIFIAHK